MPLIAARVAAVWVIFLIPLSLLFLWMKAAVGYRLSAVEALAATTLGLTINHVMGAFFYHARPFVHGIGQTYIEHSASSSFPSNHGTIMFTVAFVLAFSKIGPIRKLGLLLLIHALLVAWARVFIGVHWPLDMVGAVMLAGILTVLVKTSPARRLIDMLAAQSVALYRTLFSKFIERGWFAA